MLRTGHWCAAIFAEANVACASQVLLHDGWAQPAMVGVGATLGVGMATWNDWDLNSYRESWNPFVSAVRRSAQFGYTFHTEKDQARWAWREKRYADWEPNDLHRGPTHCTEWCLVMGLIIGTLAQIGFGLFGLQGWWLGVGAFVGLFSHVCADAITPAGVPFSAVYNYFVHGEVWKRHAVGWRIPYSHVMRTMRFGTARREIAPLNWIRYPAVVAADERHDGCRPGLLYSDRGGDKLFQIYMMLPATVVSMLVWLGAFNPVAHVLTLHLWPS